MPTRGINVYALEAKIFIIAEVLYLADKIPSPSRAELAAHAGIEYDTLKSAWQKGRLSAELQDKIAIAGGFSTGDPSWVDPNVGQTDRFSDASDNERARRKATSYTGRDHPDSFRQMLLKLHKIGGTDFRRVQDHKPRLADQNLATFSVDGSGQVCAATEPIPLFFSISIDLGYHPKGIGYGFRRVRLKVLHKRSEEADVDRSPRFRSNSTLSRVGDATLAVRGDDHHREWFLQSPSALLKGDFVTTEQPFCFLAEVALGDRFEAEMSIRTTDGTLVSVDGEELPKGAKAAIVEILLAKRIGNPEDTQGWITLGQQAMTVVKGDPK